jgi:hypothetical protein
MNVATGSGATETFQLTGVAALILQHRSGASKMISKEAVSHLVRRELRVPTDRVWNTRLADEKARAFFGAPTAVITTLWNDLESELEDAAMPKHLLWGLLFMKVYASEAVHCALVGWPCRTTFRKWSWYFIEKIALLEAKYILLDNRFINADTNITCFISIDGTDCPVMEPWPFDKKWYSKKMNGPAVKYEVGVCIRTGEIVWFKGPFCASVNDATIFKEDLAHRLCDDEGVETDAGYKGHDAFKSKQTSVSREQRKQKSQVRARHEIINSRLKQFNVLNFPFRHLKLGSNDMLHKHGICFAAIAVITHLKMLVGEGTTYDVEYSIGYH